MVWKWQQITHIRCRKRYKRTLSSRFRILATRHCDGWYRIGISFLLCAYYCRHERGLRCGKLGFAKTLVELEFGRNLVVGLQMAPPLDDSNKTLFVREDIPIKHPQFTISFSRSFPQIPHNSVLHQNLHPTENQLHQNRLFKPPSISCVNDPSDRTWYTASTIKTLSPNDKADVAIQPTAVVPTYLKSQTNTNSRNQHF